METTSPSVKNIPIVVIKTDGGTQMRDLCQETIDRYAEIMAEDPRQFPPVQVVHDGKNFWLWDGYHRLFAAKKAKLRTLPCSVVPGTQRDAFIKSLGANADHGKPRDAATNRYIIEKVESDPELSKLTDAEVARITRLSRNRVSEIRKSIRVSRQETSDMVGSDHTGIKSSVKSTNVSDKSDEVNESAEVDKPEVQKGVVDQVGNEIPEHIREIFVRRHILVSMMSKLEGIRMEINQLQQCNDPLLSYFNANAFESVYKDLHRLLRFALPHAVCGYCGGDGGIDGKCRACRGTGWVNETIHQSTPKGLK